MSFLDGILTGEATALKTPTTKITVNTSEPVVGYVLKVSEVGVAPKATWQPSAASALASSLGDVDVSASTPVSGYYLRLTDLTHADWAEISLADGESDGLMSASDFNKLAGIDADIQAQVDTLASISSTHTGQISTLSSTSATHTSDIAANTAAIASQRDPIWSPPSVATADNDEFTTDTLASGTWILSAEGSATPFTRDGAFDLSVAVAGGHYRSSVIGGVLWIQLPVNQATTMWKPISATFTNSQLYYAGIAMPTEFGSANTQDPKIALAIWRNSAGGPDNANRALVRTGSSNERYELLTTTGGATTSNPATNAAAGFTFALDGLALRIEHGVVSPTQNAFGFGFKRNGSHNTVLGGVSPQMNTGQEKVGFFFQCNVAFSLAASSAVVGVHFFRRVAVAGGGWIAQN